MNVYAGRRRPEQERDDPPPGESAPARSTVRRPALTRLNINDARCEALFASWLQRSDSPTAERVAGAISRAVRQFGTRGCAGRMAQEFGDHPEEAADRMRWVRQLAAATARPASPGPEPPGRSPELATARP